MNYTRSDSRQRGLATFFAVAGLGMVATALLAMTTMLRIDHRRTQGVVVDAQLRQLLLVGAAAAEAHLGSHSDSPRTGDLDLPHDLAQAGGRVRWEPTAPTHHVLPEKGVSITVWVAYANASAYQHLHFVADPGVRRHRLAGSKASR